MAAAILDRLEVIAGELDALRGELPGPVLDSLEELVAALVDDAQGGDRGPRGRVERGANRPTSPAVEPTDDLRDRGDVSSPYPLRSEPATVSNRL